MKLSAKIPAQFVRNLRVLAGPEVADPANILIGTVSGRAVAVLESFVQVREESHSVVMCYDVGSSDIDTKQLYLISDTVQLLNALQKCTADLEIEIESHDGGLVIKVPDGDNTRIAYLVPAGRIADFDIVVDLPMVDVQRFGSHNHMFLQFDGKQFGGFKGNALMLVPLDDPLDRQTTAEVLNARVAALQIPTCPNDKFVAMSPEQENNMPETNDSSAPAPNAPSVPPAPSVPNAPSVPSAPVLPSAEGVQLHAGGVEKTTSVTENPEPASQHAPRPFIPPPVADPHSCADSPSPETPSEDAGAGVGAPPAPTKPQRKPRAPKNAVAEVPAASTNTTPPAEPSATDGPAQGAPDTAASESDESSDDAASDNDDGTTDTEGKAKRTRRSPKLLDDEAVARLTGKGWCVIPPAETLLEDPSPAAMAAVVEQTTKTLAAYSTALSDTLAVQLRAIAKPAAVELPTAPAEIRAMLSELISRLPE